MKQKLAPLIPVLSMANGKKLFGNDLAFVILHIQVDCFLGDNGADGVTAMPLVELGSKKG